MSADYTLLRRLLTVEQRRRAAHYRYKPAQRAQAEREIADALAALERLRRAAEWNGLGKTAAKFWQDKFDG